MKNGPSTAPEPPEPQKPKKKKIGIIIGAVLAIVLILGGVFYSKRSSDTIVWTEPEIESAVRQKLNKPNGAISVRDVHYI